MEDNKQEWKPPVPKIIPPDDMGDTGGIIGVIPGLVIAALVIFFVVMKLMGAL